MLENNYIKELKKMRLYNSLLIDKLYTNNITISMDNSKVHCKGFRVGGILLNCPQGLAKTINKVNSMTVEHIEKAFVLPIRDEYIELAETRKNKLQYTVEYKKIINMLFEYAVRGNIKEVETNLIELKLYIISMMEGKWIATQ